MASWIAGLFAIATLGGLAARSARGPGTLPPTTRAGHGAHAAMPEAPGIPRPPAIRDDRLVEPHATPRLVAGGEWGRWKHIRNAGLRRLTAAPAG